MTKTVPASGCLEPACPTPNCVFQEPLPVPCGCGDPETVVVEAEECVTECPKGCATTTVKVTEFCATETGTGTGTGSGTRTGTGSGTRIAKGTDTAVSKATGGALDDGWRDGDSGESRGE